MDFHVCVVCGVALQNSVAGVGSWVSRQTSVVSRFLDVDGLNKCDDIFGTHVTRTHVAYGARLARQRRVIRALIGFINNSGNHGVAGGCCAGGGAGANSALNGADLVSANSRTQLNCFSQKEINRR